MREPGTAYDNSLLGKDPQPAHMKDYISLKSEKLNILFVRVEQDSRCLQDTTCVWAGQATILIKVSMDGQNLGDFTLSLSPGQDASVKIDERYSIKLVDLHPYPRKNQVVEGTNYQATLLVSPLR